MKVNLILPLLFLWGNVDFTLTNEVCSQLPTVERAFVKDEHRKEQYQQGDVIYFSCDPGNTTEFNITYFCTEDGWRASTTRHCIVPCKFLLDPNTTYKFLHVSEDLRSVAYEGQHSYPRHQDRFKYYAQVLSSSGLRGRCYWEVDWRLGDGDYQYVYVAMSYRRICREIQEECEFGHSDHSWSLRIRRGKQYYILHNKTETELSSTVGMSSGRVGVFLDWEGGALSFYDVISNVQRFHLYAFNNTFTEELLPGFRVWGTGTSVSVVDLNQD